MTDIYENFMYNLRLLLAAEDISQKKAAEKFDIAINVFEGRTQPKLEDLVKISVYFKISYNELLCSKIQLNIASNEKERRI